MFRDPPFFRALREQVVPLLRTYPSLKVWVAGCSTGEEVYSLAILLREEGLLERTLIYATDINAEALQRAEAGIYDLDRMALFSETYRAAGRPGVALGLLHRGLRGGASSTSRCAGTSSSPTTASRPTGLRRGPARHLPQRPHLLRPRAPGPRRAALPRRSLPQGASSGSAPRRRSASRSTPTRSNRSSSEVRIYRKR